MSQYKITIECEPERLNIILPGIRSRCEMVGDPVPFIHASPEEIERARYEYAEDSDNDIEIDDDAGCSPTDCGTWVQAWVWLPNTDEEGEADED